jgi:hypothetical protein
MFTHSAGSIGRIGASRAFRPPPQGFDQVGAIDAQVIQHDDLGPFVDRIHTPKLDPCEFNRLHALAWPAGRSACFGSHPCKKPLVHSSPCLEVAASILHGRYFFPRPSESIASLLVVSVCLQWNHYTACNPLIRLDFEQSWVVIGQTQREFDIARCLQNNCLRLV